MTWFIYALIALLSYVGYDLLSRFLATQSTNPRVFSTLFNLTVAALTPFIFIFEAPHIPQLTPISLLFMVIGVGVWGLFARVEYYAHAHVDASTLTIILELAPALNFLLAIIFLQDTITPSKILGIIFIMLANLAIFASDKKTNLISRQGVIYALEVAVTLAVAWLLDAINVKIWGVGTYTLISYLGAGIICGLFPHITIDQIKKELVAVKPWKIAILSATNLVGFSATLKALSLGQASNIMPIVTSTSPFVVLFGYLVLKERGGFSTKVLSAIMTVAAVYLLR